MTQKRFYVAESNLIEGYCVFDREKKYAFNPQEKKENCMSICKVLNELHEENIELKNNNTDLYCMNEQLRLEIQRLEEGINDEK